MTIDVNKKYMLTGGQIEDLASRLALTGEEVADKAEKAQTGSTAPTTSTPGEIGQLYIQSDGTVYILKSIVEESGQPDEYTWEEVGAGGASYTAGDGIDITNDVISATNTGKVRELTSADYNWPTSDPRGVAMWLLPEGVYSCDATTQVYPDNGASAVNRPLFFKFNYGDKSTMVYYDDSGSNAWKYWKTVTATGARNSYGRVTPEVIDSLTSTSTSDALSANQGKVLKDLADAIDTRTTTLEGTVENIEPQSGSGAPTSSTEGTVGQTYVDSSTGDIYYLSEIIEESGQADTYVWKSFASGDTITPLTSANYNWNNTAGDSTTTPFDSIALWLLDPGIYTIAEAGIYIKGEISHRTPMRVGNTILITPPTHTGPYDIKGVFFTSGEGISHYSPTITTGSNFVHKGDVLYSDSIGYARKINSELYNAASQSGGANDYCQIWRLPSGTYYGIFDTVLVQEYSQGPLIPSDDTIYIISDVSGGLSSRCILKITTEGAYKLNFIGGEYASTDKLLTEGDISITMTDTDPGEGATVNENEYIAVYGGDPIIMDYSTNEVNTGAKWIDGSAIYKKTINTGALPNNGSKDALHNITNLGAIINLEGYATNGSVWLNLPAVAANPITAHATNTAIHITTTSDRSSYTESYVTIYYTKSS